jgi:hypothetical protein
MAAIFTLDIDGRPTVAFEAKNLHEASQLSREQWFRDDVAQLESGGVTLWDGTTSLKTRNASDAEKEFFFEAAEEAADDGMILVYLVELDVSTLRAVSNQSFEVKMDTDKDDKSIVGKTVDAVKDFAATVSKAAHKIVEPEPIKSDDEILVMPATPTGFMDDAVTPPVIIRRRKKSAKKSRAKTAKKSTKKSTKKNAKKSAKKAKSPIERKRVGNKARKGAKKKKK